MAADASVLMPAVHSSSTSERAMLVEALDKLGPDDVLLLDRGDPAARLINLLNARGIRFILRCDTTGSASWTALRMFMHGDQPEAMVQLTAPCERPCRAFCWLWATCCTSSPTP